MFTPRPNSRRKNTEQLNKLDGYILTFQFFQNSIANLQAQYQVLVQPVMQPTNVLTNTTDESSAQPKPIDESLLEYISPCTEAYNSFLKAYDALKPAIKKDFPSIDVEEIEQSVIQAAKEKALFDNLLFYPEHQKDYQTTASHAKDKNALELRNLNDERQELEEKYQQRTESYHKFCYRAGLASLAIVGIPFLLGGLLVTALDHLITKLRVTRNQKAELRSEKECAVTISEKEKMINELIQNDKKSILKQGLFSLNKTIHDPKHKAIKDETMKEEQQLARSPSPGKTAA